MYDVIIVGSGPSGSTAARFASNLGLKTLLLESKKLPRYKPCGGAISLSTFAYLRKFFSYKEMKTAFIEKETRGGRIYDKYRLISTVKTPKPNIYFTLRDRFDYFLAQKAQEAGADLRDKSYVRNLTIFDDHVQVSLRGGEELKTKMLIGADGSNSIVAKKTNLRKNWNPSGIALGFEVEYEVGKDRVSSTTDNLPDIHFGIVPSGYAWTFPKEHILSIGIGAISHKLHPKSFDFFNFFKHNPLFKGLSKPKKIFGHPIPFGDFMKNPSTKRVLLSGDAAGFVDPFLGEGIRSAMRSGQFAAETIAEALSEEKENNQRFLKSYGRKCHHVFGKEFIYAYRFRELFLNPLLYPIVIKLIESNQKLADMALGLLDGTTLYSEYTTKIISHAPIFLKNLGVHLARG